MIMPSEKGGGDEREGLAGRWRWRWRWPGVAATAEEAAAAVTIG